MAEWLSGPRGRLLRRAAIGGRRRVLELGCGHCCVTPELVRRAKGPVVAVDRGVCPALAAGHTGAGLCCADATALPFSDGAFDLALCQNVLLWAAGPPVGLSSRATEPLDLAISELYRVLAPGGAVVVLEPDYGGMMEYPQDISLSDLWLGGLTAAGADPLVGRRLPGAFERAGFSVWLELQGIPQPATPEATTLLLDLPLDENDRARVRATSEALEQTNGTWTCFVHVPYFLLVATKG